MENYTKNLPVLGITKEKTQSLCEGLKSSAADIYRLICLDPFLLIKIYENYAALNPKADKSYRNLPSLIIKIGLVTIKAILYHITGDENRQNNTIDEEKELSFLEKSLKRALLAKSLAENEGKNLEFQEECYIAGLICNIKEFCGQNVDNLNVLGANIVDCVKNFPVLTDCKATDLSFVKIIQEAENLSNTENNAPILKQVSESIEEAKQFLGIRGKAKKEAANV